MIAEYHSFLFCVERLFLKKSIGRSVVLDSWVASSNESICRPSINCLKNLFDADNCTELNKTQMEGSAVDTNKQLNEVCSSLSSRLTAGIERTLRQLRIAEDKEMLANEAHSLLRHTLSGTTHVPAESLLDGDMKTLATRSIPQNGDVLMTNGTKSRHDEIDDGFVVLAQPKISQSLDNSREYVHIVVSGVISDLLNFSDNTSSQQVRLDIYVHATACMCWESIWTTVPKAGEHLSVISRTSWRDVMSYAASGGEELQLQLGLLLDDGRIQRIGKFSMLTPAMLLQQQVVGKPESNADATWPLKQVTLIAEDSPTSPFDDSIYKTNICGVITNTKRSGRMSKIEVKASDDLSLAAYVAGLKQSIPETSKLRLHAIQRERVQELQEWAYTLGSETATFRSLGAKCTQGFGKADVRKLFHKQIALDEAIGKCKESD